MPRSIHRSRWLALAFVSLTGCGGTRAMSGGFDLAFPDNRAADVGQVAQTVAASRSEEAPALVVLAPPAPARGLTVFALPTGQRLWQTAERVDTRPTVVGDVVVSHVERAVIGWSASDGRERWRLSDRGHALIGAGGDAELLALTLGPGSISRRQGVILALDPRTGATRFERTVEQSLGRPTAGGGFVFVPWSGQYLSIFDARGEERARLRNLNDVIGRVERQQGAVYFGARALYRLGPEAAAARRDPNVTFALPREDLPGTPTLTVDGYAPSMAGMNARERVSVIYRADPSQGGTAMVDGLVYALFHRVIFALDAHDGAVRWAFAHTADIAGAEPVRGGLMLVDERGEAALLDARGGHAVWRQSLGTRAAQAVIHVPLDFAPPRTSGETPLTPAATLIAAAGGTDSRMLPARLFATRALAVIPGVEATQGLIDIASRRGYPPALRTAAGEALSRRTEGTDAMLAALESHYDYVRQTSAPPVGFIARALATARERRGVPALVSHLQDPDTPAEELPLLVAALQELGEPSAVPALLDFVRLYHADDGPVPALGGGNAMNDRSLQEQEAINAALTLAVQAIARLAGPVEQRWLQALAVDSNTLEPVRLALVRTLQSDPTVTPTTASAGAAGSEEPDEERFDPNLPPPRISMAMIRNAMDPARPQMMQCLNGMTSRPSQVRVSFRYDRTGTITDATVTPPTLQPCLAPLVQRVRLPASQVAREIGTYYLLGGPQ
jgi:outer membrane protein assembly factor BamB